MGSVRAKVSRSVLVGVFVVVCLMIATPAPAAGNPSATGGGTAVELGEKSTFTFNAVEHNNGAVIGHLVYNFRAGDISFHMDIDCMAITGNQAVLSGTVTKVSGNVEDYPFIFVGQDGVFQVQDNGEGGGASPDLFSDVNLDLGLNCNNSLPDPYIPISGNIQVDS